MAIKNNQQLIADAIEIALDLVEVIQDYDNPYLDPSIEAILFDPSYEIFRDYHPISLFTAINFVDELAQMIKPKPVAEMSAAKAWVWEMNRVLNLIHDNMFGAELSRNKLIQGMSSRIFSIVRKERRKYGS